MRTVQATRMTKDKGLVRDRRVHGARDGPEGLPSDGEELLINGATICNLT